MRCEKALQASKLAKLPCCGVSRRHRRHCAPSGKRGNHVAAVRGIILHDDASFPKVVLVLQVGTRRRTTHDHHKDDGLKRERKRRKKKQTTHNKTEEKTRFRAVLFNTLLAPNHREQTPSRTTLNTTWFLQIEAQIRRGNKH